MLTKKINWILFIALVSILFQCQNADRNLIFTVKNPLNIERPNETISIPLKTLTVLLISDPLKIEIFEEEANNELLSQLIDSNADGEYESIIFQSNFMANEVKKFVIKESGHKIKKNIESKVFAKFVPTRKDDIAWENDRIAYRMYGPALQADGEISSGVDVWVKSVRKLVLDDWYKQDDYHKDHGEGLDYYKVGPSLGCGGIAVWRDGEMYASNNFSSWKIIANGPIRTIIELTYAPWLAGDDSVSEVKRIILDAGQNLNRFESSFKRKDKKEINMCAIGLVKRQNPGIIISNADNGWLSYWEPADKENGTTGCAVVVNPERLKRFVETDTHNLAIVNTTPINTVVYYAGAGWDKSDDFKSREDWENYIKHFSECLASPLEVVISD